MTARRRLCLLAGTLTLALFVGLTPGPIGPAHFHWVHNLAVDSKGNIYTTEVDTGKRAQKFLFKGVGPVER